MNKYLVQNLPHDNTEATILLNDLAELGWRLVTGLADGRVILEQPDTVTIHRSLRADDPMFVEVSAPQGFPGDGLKEATWTAGGDAARGLDNG